MRVCIWEWVPLCVPVRVCVCVCVCVCVSVQPINQSIFYVCSHRGDIRQKQKHIIIIYTNFPTELWIYFGAVCVCVCVTNLWRKDVNQWVEEWVLSVKGQRYRSELPLWLLAVITRPQHYWWFQMKVYIKIISFFALKPPPLILFGHYGHKPDRACCFKSV